MLANVMRAVESHIRHEKSRSFHPTQIFFRKIYIQQKQQQITEASEHLDVDEAALINADGVDLAFQDHHPFNVRRLREHVNRLYRHHLERSTGVFFGTKHHIEHTFSA